MPSDCIVSSRDQLIAGTTDYGPEKLTWHDMFNQGYLTPLQLNCGYIIDMTYYDNINIVLPFQCPMLGVTNDTN